MTPIVWLQLVLLSLLWGTSFVLIGATVHEVGALQVAWARIAGGALFMLACCLLAGHSLRGLGWRFWAGAVLLGLLNNAVPFSLISSGQLLVSAELAAILNATTPFFAALVAHVFTGDERLTANRLAGIGIAAVAVLVGPAALAALGSGGAGGLLGQAMILGAALSYACGGVYGKRFRGTAPSVMTASMLLMATAAMTPALAWTGPLPLVQAGPAAWAILAVLGIACTGLAYILYFRILAAAGATNVLLVTLLVPFTTAGLGALVLDQGLSLRAGAALALITMGLLVFDGRPLAALRATLRARLRRREA